MGRNNLGKLVLSFVLVVGAVVATAVDWNTTHLFNPAWHLHARFHDAMYLLFLDATSLLVLWLLWRRSTEPTLGVTVAALFLAAVWTPFFYIAGQTDLVNTEKTRYETRLQVTVLSGNDAARTV